MPHLLRDLRYACRGLLRAPLFTLVAVVSIALGIGANTAIFTLVDQVLLRQLPVSEPEQLVLFTQASPHFGNNRGGNAMSLNVGYGGQTDRVSDELVSGTYFPVLGVGAAVGRVITPEDDRIRASHPVAVLSYEYWRTRFGADTGVIGKTIVVNNYPLTIIGVS